MTFIKTSLAFAISTSLFSTVIFADDNTSNIEQDLEIITVNGDFRHTSLQKTASSLSVISSDDINARSAQNLEEIINATPNVNFSSGSQRARFYQIRGIGERSQFKEPINPSVGIIIDDIDFSGIGSIASMFDVAQTEIFRGPQGTRFGANAMAGLINITTKAPSDTFESALRFTAGNYHSFGAGIVLSGPATDTVNYRLAAEQYKSDGFIENDYLNINDTNNRDEISIRGKLAIQANDNLAIDLTVFHFDFDNGYDAFSLDNNRTTFSDEPGFDRQKTTAVNSKFTYTGFNAFKVTTIVSHADSDLGYAYDEDWAFGQYDYDTGECITQTGCFADSWGYSSADHYFRDRKTTTGEIRLTSNESSQMLNGTTSWVTGFYIKQDDEDLLRQYTFLDNDFTSVFNTETLAAFAQFDTQLSERLILTSGLRIEHRSADYNNSDGLVFSPNDTMVGGKLVLSFEQDENTLFYGSINRGYKAGGVNTEGTLTPEQRVFDPEFVLNYELGYKVNLLNNNAFIRIAAFYMDRQDIQIKSSHPVTGTREFIIYWDNAAKGFNQGLEVDGSWQITPNVELYGALGLLDTEFNGIIDSNGLEIPARDQAHAPNYQFSLGINYYPNENWLVNLTLDGKDEFYFSDSHDQKSDTVEVINASIAYLQDNWDVRLWVRNLLDENYSTRGFYFGNDARDNYTAKSYEQLAEPVVFGVTFDYNF